MGILTTVQSILVVNLVSLDSFMKAWMKAKENGMGEGEEEERGSREEEGPLLPIPRCTAVQGAYSLFLPVLLYVWLDPSRFGNSPEAGTSAFTDLAGMGTGYSSCRVGVIFWSGGWFWYRISSVTKYPVSSEILSARGTCSLYPTYSRIEDITG